MSLKIEFVERAARGEKVAALCREFGVSRQSGHKWIKRFKELGYDGLEEQSRRPKTTPLATAEELVIAVLEARDAHPRWGPRKLEPLLRRRFGEQTPSVRTIARILKRANKVRARRRNRPPNIVECAPQVQAKTPNDVWTVDFKGWWRVLDGERCEPLTVRDAFSRFVLESIPCRATHDAVRAVFERLFRSTASRMRSSVTTARRSSQYAPEAGFPGSRPGGYRSASGSSARDRGARKTTVATNECTLT